MPKAFYAGETETKAAAALFPQPGKISIVEQIRIPSVRLRKRGEGRR
jgi:hypothetical protein